MPRQGIEGFRPTNAAPAIVPVQRSVLGNAAGSVRAPPRALVDRPVVARLAPPRAPVVFAKEQAAIRANGGRPLSMTELARMRPYTPATPVRLAGPGGNVGVRVSPSMQTREHTLQQPALPPSRALRNDRPVWAQGYQRQVPQQRFAPAYTPPRETAPRAAPSEPARAPEARPETRPPPSRADAESAEFGTGYATQWQSPPPMYRPQESGRFVAPPVQLQPRNAPYRPPMSPPPMYRPIPLGGGAARPAPRSSGNLAVERPHRSG